MKSKGCNHDAAAYNIDSALGPETYDRIYAQPYTEALNFYVACAIKRRPFIRLQI